MIDPPPVIGFPTGKLAPADTACVLFRINRKFSFEGNFLFAHEKRRHYTESFQSLPQNDDLFLR